MTVDAIARHRLLQMAGVPVAAMRVPPRVEWRDDEIEEDLEDEELDELDLEDDLDEDASEDEESEEGEDLDDEEPDDEEEAAPSEAAQKRHRMLELLGVELRAATNPAPGRQVVTREGAKKYGLPIGSTILPGMRALTAAQQAAVEALSDEDRPKYLAARREGATHAAAMKAAGAGPAPRKAAAKAAPAKATKAADFSTTPRPAGQEPRRGDRAVVTTHEGDRVRTHTGVVGLEGTVQWDDPDGPEGMVVAEAYYPPIRPAKAPVTKAAKPSAPAKRAPAKTMPPPHPQYGEPLRRRTPRDGDVAVWTTPDGESVTGRVKRVPARTETALQGFKRRLPARWSIEWEGGRTETFDTLDPDVTLYAGEATPAKATKRIPAKKATPSRRAGISPDEYAQRYDKAIQGGLSPADAAKYARSDFDSPSAWKAAHAPVKKAPAFDAAEVAGRIASQKTEAAVIRLLSGDSTLTAAKLKKVAEYLGIDVPDNVRAKTSLQLLIAESEAKERDLPSGLGVAATPAKKVTAPKAPEQAARLAPVKAAKTAVPVASAPSPDHSAIARAIYSSMTPLGSGREDVDEAGIRRILAGLPTTGDIRRVARDFRTGGDEPPLGSPAEVLIDWLIGQLRRTGGRRT